MRTERKQPLEVNENTNVKCQPLYRAIQRQSQHLVLFGQQRCGSETCFVHRNTAENTALSSEAEW